VSPSGAHRVEQLAGGAERGGASILRGVLRRELLVRLRRHAELRYAAVAEARSEAGPWGARALLPPEFDYQPTASSVRLGDDARDLLGAALGPVFSASCAPPAAALATAWLRRQHPAYERPALAAPHSWHQDGALGADFALTDDLLPLVTAWCPLDPCGGDAPGLELLPDLPAGLLRPPELAALDARGRLPRLQPGDVVLMGAALLHRTGVRPGMSRVRTSAELRFVTRPLTPREQQRVGACVALKAAPRAPGPRGAAP
jgi:hypothetical protein